MTRLQTADAWREKSRATRELIEAITAGAVDRNYSPHEVASLEADIRRLDALAETFEPAPAATRH